MATPDDRRYTRDHLWVDFSSATTARVGITAFASSHLENILHFALEAAAGTALDAGAPFGYLEAVGGLATESVTELDMPVSTTVTAVNDDTVNDPQLIHQDPYEQGWLIEIDLGTDSRYADFKKLLTAKEYDAYVSSMTE